MCSYRHRPSGSTASRNYEQRLVWIHFDFSDLPIRCRSDLVYKLSFDVPLQPKRRRKRNCKYNDLLLAHRLTGIIMRIGRHGRALSLFWNIGLSSLRCSNRNFYFDFLLLCKRDTLKSSDSKKVLKRLHRSALAGFILIFAWIMWLGTAASSIEKNPQSVEQGTICQLIEEQTGEKSVRCAALLPHSLDDIWRVIVDYPAFTQVFKTRLWNISSMGSRNVNDSTVQISGVLSMAFVEIPFRTTVTHRRGSKEAVASWDQANAPITKNKGSWSVSAKGTSQSLLVYKLQFEYPPFPAPLVRNALLSQVPQLFELIEARIKFKSVNRASS